MEVIAQAETGKGLENQPVEDTQTSRFTWRIENFSRLNTKKLYSKFFVVGGCGWRILIFPKGNNVNRLSMYLDVADSASLPYGWSRYAQFSLAVINQIHHKNSVRKETQHHFNAQESDWGFTSLMSLDELYNPSGGYLVNDTCIIEAEFVYDSKEETGKQPSDQVSEADALKVPENNTAVDQEKTIEVEQTASQGISMAAAEADALKVPENNTMADQEKTIEMEQTASQGTSMATAETTAEDFIPQHIQPSTGFPDLDVFLASIADFMEEESREDASPEPPIIVAKPSGPSSALVDSARKTLQEAISSPMADWLDADKVAALMTALSVLTTSKELMAEQHLAILDFQSEFLSAPDQFKMATAQLADIDALLQQRSGMIEAIKGYPDRFKSMAKTRNELKEKQAKIEELISFLQAELVETKQKEVDMAAEMDRLQKESAEKIKESVRLKEVPSLKARKKAAEKTISKVHETWAHFVSKFK